MTSDRLQDLWPSLRTMDMRRIVDPEREDPAWMTDLSPVERDELREACDEELRMLEFEARRRSPDGHPELGDNWCIDYKPIPNGGFKRVVTEDETGTE